MMWSPTPAFIELPSGLVVPQSAAPPPRPKAVDLFCGCGGFSLGMIQGGFDVVGAVDNDPHAAMTYLTNLGAYPLAFHFIADDDAQRMEKALWKAERAKERGRERGRLGLGFVSGSNRQPGWGPGVGHFWLGDARKLRGADMLAAMGLERGELDCVFGGPPCQGMSYIGKRQVHDPRNSLVFEFARLVVEMQPKTVAMENVPGIVDMVTPDGFPLLDAFCRVLADGGFGTLDAVKRGLLATSGAGAVVRGNGRPATRDSVRDKRRPAKKNRAPQQVELRLGGGVAG